MSARHPHLFLAVLLLGGSSGCGGVEPESTRALSPGTVVLGSAWGAGRLERPAVEFQHDKHVAAALTGGCSACHPPDQRGRLSPKFSRLADGEDRSVLTHLYHDRCMGCHAARAHGGSKSGPVTCGECHVRREGRATSVRATVAFDYALHFRHMKAEKESCGRCHHVKNAVTGRLLYQKGAEEACATCHGATAQGKVPSLESASHQSCIGCHLEREKAKAKGGPTACAGCHARKVPSVGSTTLTVARLTRGQKEQVLISAADQRQPGVPFDHRTHEPKASFCSTCHHRSLRACSTCHTFSGKPEGGEVTLQAAYHRATSTRSCVGCHAERTAQKDCAGCHQAMEQPPQARACPLCHQNAVGAASQPAKVERPPLPPVSKDFPETVTLSTLAKQYKPSVMPHRRIVARLDAAVRKSGLATRFHGSAEVLCAGCHHRGPSAGRPAKCRACHTGSAASLTDRPGLKAALHRQCMGCHQEMGISKNGCTDCHAREKRP